MSDRRYSGTRAFRTLPSTSAPGDAGVMVSPTSWSTVWPPGSGRTILLLKRLHEAIRVHFSKSLNLDTWRRRRNGLANIMIIAMASKTILPSKCHEVILAHNSFPPKKTQLGGWRWRRNGLTNTCIMIYDMTSRVGEDDLTLKTSSWDHSSP